MKIRNLLLIIGSILAVAAAAPVLADINYTQGAGTVIFDFTCFTTKHCSGHVPINSNGVEIATSGNPFRVDPTGATTQPVSAASLPLPTGAATSTNQGATTDPPCTLPASATACSEIAIAKATANAANGSVPTGANTIGAILPYPAGAVPLTASATGTTAATTATLAGAVGKTTYICGYSIRANATAAATVTNTITGVITATMSSIMWVAPLASGIGIDEQIFAPCIPASATNTGIAIVSGAPGSGGTVSSKGWGYQL